MEPRTSTIVVAFFLTAQLSAVAASAQAAPQAPKTSRTGATIAWTAVGAGAGFGLGVWAGLNAFDDAINSDRKVWTTALLGAAAGGVLGFVVARGRAKPAAKATSNQTRAAEHDARLRQSAPRLGSGAYRGWLERPLLVAGEADGR